MTLNHAADVWAVMRLAWIVRLTGMPRACRASWADVLLVRGTRWYHDIRGLMCRVCRGVREEICDAVDGNGSCVAETGV
jgi:hypothetical protein